MKKAAFALALILLNQGCSTNQASYNYTQKQIENEDLGFAQKLRVNEYINAFPQNDLPAPEAGKPLSLSMAYLQDHLTDKVNKTLVQVAVKSRGSLPSEKALKAGICVVLDVSGSMDDDRKLIDAKIALKRFIAELSNGNQFSLVTFNDASTLITSPVTIDNSSRSQIIKSIDQLVAGGGTDIYSGLVEGYKQLTRMKKADVSRLILITDGMSTVGNATPAMLAHVAGTQYAENIRISTIGLGHDVDENVLRRIAEQGKGHYYFADKADTLSAFLTTDLKTVIFPVAKEVILTLTPTKGFRITAVYGYQDHPSDYGVAVNIPLGELNIEDWRIVIAELEGTSSPGSVTPISAKLSYQGLRSKKQNKLIATKPLTFGENLDSHSDINKTVARNGVIFADAMALIKASELEREQKYQQAADILSVQMANISVVAQWDDTDSMKKEYQTLERTRVIIQKRGKLDNGTTPSISNSVGNSEDPTGTKSIVQEALRIAEKTVPGPWSLLVSLFSLFIGK